MASVKAPSEHNLDRSLFEFFSQFKYIFIFLKVRSLFKVAMTTDEIDVTTLG